jgi:hypothetical protein
MITCDIMCNNRLRNNNKKKAFHSTKFKELNNTHILSYTHKKEE